MKAVAPVRVLLGPQSPVSNIAAAVANAEIPDGPLAVISAAWQETEGDIGEVGDILGRDVEDLYLYRREEDLLAGYPELQAAARLRQTRLIEQQKMYRLRLKQLNIAARKMMSADGDAEMVAAEQRHAIAQLRALDRHHLHRSESIWRRFSDVYSRENFPALAQQAQEIGEVIDRCAGVVITGGNVAVLINRMRLFGVDKLLRDRHVVAWSAGAMALAERVVLFHDHAPEGRRDAEVLGSGCGVIPGYIFLPDTKHRLKKSDRRRVGLLSRRFSPDVCIALDCGAELHFDTVDVTLANGVQKLGVDGRMARLKAA